MKKLTVEYIPDDNLLEKYSDASAWEKVSTYVKDISESQTGVFHVFLTSQELIVNYFRLAILKGLIHHTDVEFLYKDFVMFPDKYGHLDWWPDGFCDYTDKLLTEMLQDMFDVHKKG